MAMELISSGGRPRVPGPGRQEHGGFRAARPATLDALLCGLALAAFAWLLAASFGGEARGEFADRAPPAPAAVVCRAGGPSSPGS